MQQALLFEAAPAEGPISFDPEFSGSYRDDLGSGAWLEYVPRWLRGHQLIHDELCETVPWKGQRRRMYDRIVEVPRLLGPVPESGRPSILLPDMAEALSERYGTGFASISLARYRDGRDSVAMHGDRMGDLVDDCVIAVVAVGAPRRFLLREADGNGARTLDFGCGDLLVMGGTCQRTWLHGVPKTARAAPRISIQFRPRSASTGTTKRQP